MTEPTTDFLFRPDQAMQPMTIRNLQDLGVFYEKFTRFLLPNMPRNRSWANVSSHYFDYPVRMDIEQKVRAGKTILDCGSGPRATTLRTLFEHLDKYYPADTATMSAIALDPGLETDVPIDARIQKVKAYAEDMSAIADNSVDIMMATEVWQYIADKPRFLRESYRVLSPGADCHINIDSHNHDLEGTRRLLSFSNLPENSYRFSVKAMQGGDRVTLHLIKSAAVPDLSFPPYEVNFTGVEQVQDYMQNSPLGKAARHENLYHSTPDTRPYLAPGLYCPRFTYSFMSPNKIPETVDLWVQRENRPVLAT